MYISFHISNHFMTFVPSIRFSLSKTKIIKKAVDATVKAISKTYIKTKEVTTPKDGHLARKMKQGTYWLPTDNFHESGDKPCDSVVLLIRPKTCT